MNTRIILVFCLLFSSLVFAQTPGSTSPFDFPNTKYYQKNSFEKDLFFFSKPSNDGTALNPLSLNYSDLVHTRFQPKGKSDFLQNQQEVRYFDVKTPLTEFSLENATEEGYYLRTLFTRNLSPNWNFALQYKALKSLGRYQRQTSDHGSFNANTHYTSPNNRFSAELSFLQQNIINQENGGIKNIEDYSSGNPDFFQRSRMEVNLEDANSVFHTKSILFQGKYKLYKNPIKIDSLQAGGFYLKNKSEMDYSRFVYTASESSFDDPEVTSFFGPSNSATIFDQNRWKSMGSTLFFGFENSSTQIEVGPQFISGSFYQNELDQNTYDYAQIGFQGSFEKKWDNLKASTKGQYLLGTDFFNTFNLEQEVVWSGPKFQLGAGLVLASKAPDYNFLYHNSNYTDFAYNHISDFSTENHQVLHVNLKVNPWNSWLDFSTQRIENYTYIDSNNQIKQSENPVSVSLLKANNQLQFGNIHLDNTLGFQSVNREDILPLPNIIARSSVYFQGPMFKNAAQGQIGFTAHYFSEFESRGYLPVLGEYALLADEQKQKIGESPILDVFYNLNVKRMNIYIRANNVTSFLRPANQYNFPGYPTQEFKTQIGLIWQLFN
ncbi:MAG: hypothetical protein C4K58_02055 [Flavobacteriaceae bacterium]|nr:MAG: hypothetical protein C4K58_02055 [Flavobacteriaceae bacterium]